MDAVHRLHIFFSLSVIHLSFPVAMSKICWIYLFSLFLSCVWMEWTDRWRPPRLSSFLIHILFLLLFFSHYGLVALLLFLCATEEDGRDSILFDLPRRPRLRVLLPLLLIHASPISLVRPSSFPFHDLHPACTYLLRQAHRLSLLVNRSFRLFVGLCVCEIGRAHV